MSEPLRLTKDGPFWTLTLNREEKANAIDADMLHQLERWLDEAAAETDIKTLIIQGAGGRIFSAGADLKSLRGARKTSSGAAGAMEQFLGDWARVMQKIATLPAYTIAWLNGSCIGGGISLAIACDTRVAIRDQGELFYPALKRQVLPSRADIRRLTALIGPARTKMLLIGGARLSASDAHRWGLADHLHSAKNADRKRASLLRRLEDAAPRQILAMKRMIEDPDNPSNVALCKTAMYGAGADAETLAAAQALRVPDGTPESL